MTATDSTTRVVSESGSDVGPGQRLREAREAAQLTVAEVASRLRLVPHVLDRLENDDYEQLHGPTFVRGYLSSYARLLDLPERPILEAYERHGYGPPALVSELGRKPEVHVSDFPVRIVTYVIAGLLVILVVLWWQSRQLHTDTRERADTAAELVQQTSDREATDGSSAQPPPVSPGSPLVEDKPVSMPPTAETAEPPAAAASSETTGEGETTQPPQVAMLDQQTTGSEAAHMATAPSEDSVAGESRPAQETSTESASPSIAIAAEPTGAEEEAAPALLPGSDVLAIQLAKESWVEIYDRGGGRLYYSLAREGSEVVVRGAGPMNVLLGDVESAAVAYNGEPYDLSRYRGRSVVRFTVGELSGTTGPEPPSPAAAQEPLTRETPGPTAEEHEHTVADAGDALGTPARAGEFVKVTALPAPAASAPETALLGSRPDP